MHHYTSWDSSVSRARHSDSLYLGDVAGTFSGTFIFIFIFTIEHSLHDELKMRRRTRQNGTYLAGRSGWDL